MELRKQTTIYNGLYTAETKEQYIYTKLLAIMADKHARDKVISYSVIDQILKTANEIYGETLCPVERIDESKPLYEL